MTDLQRRQMAITTENACAVFRNIEATRSVQQQTAQKSLSQHELAAQQLQKPCEPGELLAIQSNLLQSMVQGAMQYWQQLGAIALKSQVDLMEGSKHILTPVAEDPLKPILQAWQNSLAHTFNGDEQRASTTH
ncbi:phasin family protein [Rhodoferax sp. WC2427]|uniref:phasin family protein n=1 Tax=Rhodoferax sp. WC2427 TaxID=3234144 RepID=UPI0034666DD3